MFGIRNKIASSRLLWCAAVFFGAAFVLMALSLVGMSIRGSAVGVTNAITSSGISGDDAVATYISLHIAGRIVVLISTGLNGVGMLITLVSAVCRKGEHPSTAGLNLMSGFQAVVNKLVKPIGALLAVAFVYKLVMFMIKSYQNRYQNSMIYLFFATIFGEAVLAAIVVGVLCWLYHCSAACEDDLAIIQYCLIMNKQPSNSVSVTARYSLFVFSVILGYLTAVFHYDVLACFSCALTSLGCLMTGLFLWRFIGICEKLY